VIPPKKPLLAVGSTPLGWLAPTNLALCASTLRKTIGPPGIAGVSRAMRYLARSRQWLYRSPPSCHYHVSPVGEEVDAGVASVWGSEATKNWWNEIADVGDPPHLLNPGPGDQDVSAECVPATVARWPCSALGVKAPAHDALTQHVRERPRATSPGDAPCRARTTATRWSSGSVACIERLVRHSDHSRRPR